MRLQLVAGLGRRSGYSRSAREHASVSSQHDGRLGYRHRSIGGGHEGRRQLVLECELTRGKCSFGSACGQSDCLFRQTKRAARTTPRSRQGWLQSRACGRPCSCTTPPPAPAASSCRHSPDGTCSSEKKRVCNQIGKTTKSTEYHSSHRSHMIMARPPAGCLQVQYCTQAHEFPLEVHVSAVTHRNVLAL